MYMRNFSKNMIFFIVFAFFGNLLIFCQEEKKDLSPKAKDEKKEGLIPIEYKTKKINTTDKGELPQKIFYQKDTSWMVLIPAGEFTMGTDDWNKEEGSIDESPAHTVYIESFYIDQYEVTNRQYLQFCGETNHKRSKAAKDMKDGGGYDDPEQPIVGITYQDAQAYAKWAEKRLPTEAEWEKAARGTDKLIYPWGNEWDPQACNNKEQKKRQTAKVGSYPKDKSPYDVCDMAGNVSEWVSDYYDEKYYKKSPKENPTGPEEGALRIIRGGNYYYQTSDCRTTNRQAFPEAFIRSEYGFRCVKDMRPVKVAKKLTVNKDEMVKDIEKKLVVFESDFLDLYKNGKPLPDSLVPDDIMSGENLYALSSPIRREDVILHNLTDTDLSISIVNTSGKVVVYDDVIEQNHCKWEFLRSNEMYFVYFKYLDDIENIRRGGFFFVEGDRRTNLIFDLSSRYINLETGEIKTAQIKDQQAKEQVFQVAYGNYNPPYNQIVLINRTNDLIRVMLNSEDSFATVFDLVVKPKSFYEKTISNGDYTVMVKYENLPKAVFKSNPFGISPSRGRYNIVFDPNKESPKTYTSGSRVFYDIRILISFYVRVDFKKR